MDHRCSKCSYQTNKAFNLRRHNMCVHKVFKKNIHKCKYCADIFSNVRSLSVHFQSKHSRYSKWKAKLKSEKASSLELSSETTKDNNSVSVDRPNSENSSLFPTTVFVCSICQSIFENRQDYEIHTAKKLCFYDGNKNTTAKRIFGQHIKLPEVIIKQIRLEVITRNAKSKIVNVKKKKRRKTHFSTSTKEMQFACRFCDKAFIHQSSLFRHIDHIHRNPLAYKCNLCTQVFSQKICLNNHILQHHTSVRRYICDKCNYGTLQRTYFVTHIKRCAIDKFDKSKLKTSKASGTNPYIRQLLLVMKKEGETKRCHCDICGIVSRGILVFIEHMKTHTIKELNGKNAREGGQRHQYQSTNSRKLRKCPTGKMEVGDERNWNVNLPGTPEILPREMSKAHKLLSGEDIFKCQGCCKLFSSLKNLGLHRYHCNHGPNGRKQNSTNELKQAATTAEEMDNRSSENCTEYATEDEKCVNIVNNGELISQEETRLPIGTVFVCSVCTSLFESCQDHKKHKEEKLCHEGSKPPSNVVFGFRIELPKLRLKCVPDKVIRSNLLGLRSKILQKNAKRKIVKVKKRKLSSPVIRNIKNLNKCKFCGKVFSQSAILKRHVFSKHQHRLGYKCNLCLQICSKRPSLYNHILKQHTTVRRYECDNCSYGTELRGMYFYHIKRCGNYNSILKTSVIRKNPLNERNVFLAKKEEGKSKICYCEICGNVSKGIFSFIEHMQTHNENDLLKKPTKKTRYMYTLSETRKRQLQRNICKFASGRRQQRLSKSCNNKNSEVVTKIENGNVPKKNGRNPYKCVDVTENGHISSNKVHTTENIVYQCKICAIVFKKGDKLDKHIRECHPLLAAKRFMSNETRLALTNALLNFDKEQILDVSLSCQICSMNCLNEVALSNHMKRHQLSQSSSQ